MIAAQVAVRPARGADVNTLTVTRDDDDYRIVFDARVDAPAKAVYDVLADYRRLYRLSPVITAVSVQPSPDGRADRVRSVFKACMFLVCQQLVQVEDVTEPDEHTIIGVVVPAKGDFSGGRCEWQITGEGSRTHLHYEATRTIGVPVVPVLGTWIVRRAMDRHLRASVAALERLVGNRSRPPG